MPKTASEAISEQIFKIETRKGMDPIHMINNDVLKACFFPNEKSWEGYLPNDAVKLKSYFPIWKRVMLLSTGWYNIQKKIIDELIN